MRPPLPWLRTLLPGLALALALGPACTRRSAPSTADAGPGPTDAGLVRATRSMDLRTSFLFIFPENRGAFITQGRAQVTRTLRSPVDVAAFRQRAIDELHFEPQADGGPGLERMGIHLEAQGHTVAAWLPVDGDVVGRVYASPSSLTSQQLALWLPKVPQDTIEKEEFEVSIRYESTPARISFLVHQVTELLVRSGVWTPSEPLPSDWNQPDGAYGATPDPLDVQLRDPTGTVISVRRSNNSAHVRLVLRTLE